MKKALPCLFFLLVATLSGCNPPPDSTSSDDDLDDIPPYGVDDSGYFVFEKSDALKTVINEFPLGVLDDDNFELLLESLDLNDSGANRIETSLERKIDYDALESLDHQKDKEELYTKEVIRYDELLMLVGDYEESISAHGVAPSLRSADFQSYRNGYQPSVDRYFDAYDFGNISDDYIKEYVYDTEDYWQKLKLVDGTFLARDIQDKKILFENTGVFESLLFEAEKTATATIISLIGSFAPTDTVLGEKVKYTISIENGMITEVLNFKGTYELDGSTEVYRTSEKLLKKYTSITNLPQFDGKKLEIDEDFEGKRPLIDYIDIFL